MCVACIAERAAVADDEERKVALLLETGVRADRNAAEKFIASPHLQHLDEADYQHRIELLRLYGCPLEGVSVLTFRSGLKSMLLPLLGFLAHHRCALHHAVNVPSTCCAL